MLLDHITYRGPAYEADAALEALLPNSLVSLLQQINGFIQFGGGFHLRGACSAPHWHSLSAVMSGAHALHLFFGNVQKTDVPFGQDCVGDQFLLRRNKVLHLYAETGEIEETGFSLKEFFAEIERDPVGFLGMEPLQQMNQEGKELLPGQIISVYPPFCTEESGAGVSLKPVDFFDGIGFLSDFAKRISGMKDGDSFAVEFAD